MFWCHNDCQNVLVPRIHRVWYANCMLFGTSSDFYYLPTLLTSIANTFINASANVNVIWNDWCVRFYINNFYLQRKITQTQKAEDHRINTQNILEITIVTAAVLSYHGIGTREHIKLFIKDFCIWRKADARTDDRSLSLNDKDFRFFCNTRSDRSPHKSGVDLRDFSFCYRLLTCALAMLTRCAGVGIMSLFCICLFSFAIALERSSWLRI